MLEPGRLLQGRYSIERRLESGGMSEVFLAGDLRNSNSLCVIKRLACTTHTQKEQQALQALKKEAQLLAKLTHPHIALIVDVFSTGEDLCVVTEYIEGKTLLECIRETGPQNAVLVKAWALQLCDALSYLHALTPPIIYRDMKPGNIMLTPKGDVILFDLGIAREFDQWSRKTQDTVAFGTRGYAPPEQYGTGQTDARSDIYAFGVTLWHLLSGKSPSQELPLPLLSTVMENASLGFQSIIQKCCALSREERYQSVKELVADLSSCEISCEGSLANDPLSVKPSQTVLQKVKQQFLGSKLKEEVIDPPVQNASAPKQKLANKINESDIQFRFIMAYEEIVVHTDECIS